MFREHRSTTPCFAIFDAVDWTWRPRRRLLPRPEIVGWRRSGLCGYKRNVKASLRDRLAHVRRDYTDGKLDDEDWRELRDELTAEQQAAAAAADRLKASGGRGRGQQLDDRRRAALPYSS